MAYKIPLGQKMESVTVNRSNVADGIPSRALLLGEECIYGKQLAYDTRIKRSVEVDQEALIKYRFDNVYEYYYILIARLNTDMAGRVVSPDVTVEYLRLSSNQYGELVTSMNEMKHFSSLLLQKVSKRGNDGKDYSYVEVKLSNYEDIPEAALAKVEQMVNTPGFVDGIWALVDAQTSITVEEYERRLAELDKVEAAPQQTVAPQAPRPAIPASQPAAAIPQQAPAPRRIIRPATSPQQVVPQSVKVAPQTTKVTPQVQKSAGFAEIRPAAPAEEVYAPTQPSASSEDLAGVTDFEGFADGGFIGELE